MDYSVLFVCLMGLCTVFIGLICIIVLVSVMSSVVRKTDKAMGKNVPGKEADVPVSSLPAVSSESEVTPEFIAAVSACIAEEMGKDVNAIRIVSCRRV